MKNLVRFLLPFFIIITWNMPGMADNGDPVRINPTNWWIGMEDNTVQILIQGHSDGFNNQAVSINYPGVKLEKIHRLPNKHYFALDVSISPATKPGVVRIHIGKDSYDWSLAMKNVKDNGKSYAQGVTAKDLIYLIMPDRFSNGDLSNDRIPGMKDQSLNRDTVFNRHGGDLQGIINHLDYFNQLGVTALWLNPVLENDMPERTEHGYAITDHYRVDPRLGGNEAYTKLVEEAHRKGIKIIQDAIYNHIGLDHWSVTDPPSPDWLHHWEHYTQTTYKDQVLMDPYASIADRKRMSDGWFVPSMPDLNQNNPYVTNFLIQHAIWCVEQFGIDGWRIDTYAYNDLGFMNRCNAALIREYPSISLFGETWVHGVINQSYFADNNYGIAYKSNLPGVTDFQLLWGINDVMNKPFGWTDGVNKLYTTLANDFVYKDPYNNVIFLDNHDLSRAYSVYGEDLKKYKMALTWLLTCRGIPQLYYGNEVLMKGTTYPNDGYVRLDFPGGWPGDSVNKFTREGRSADENEVWDLISRLAHYRRNSVALTTGRLTQFVPEDGVYVYFRHAGDERIMCVMNSMDTDKQIEVVRFNELTDGYRSAKDVLGGSIISLQGKLNIPARTMVVWELLK
ncbi:MAG TPA: glycoside hydrolase family 13 protein [Saprospiraceae bacterium]|jgi:glycosidase|nr:glycoside hydrolase family 13 protein [Saprospiraceae bacterium]WKZ63023.1 MAG: glycoside hydrolase family 13 protein [Saprospiraceae bacterium]HPB52212.1 glycoside hydrolase family 13 protein [Saprospiraceae bacterium]HRP85220.1 glycoside hydrolase family 13 protein [Saprospiraceae bacterium]